MTVRGLAAADCEVCRILAPDRTRIRQRIGFPMKRLSCPSRITDASPGMPEGSSQRVVSERSARSRRVRASGATLGRRGATGPGSERGAPGRWFRQPAAGMGQGVSPGRPVRRARRCRKRDRQA